MPTAGTPRPVSTTAADDPAAEAICRRFWERTRALTWAELIVWLCFNLAIVWYAEPLSGVLLWGVPLSFLNLSLFSLLLFTLLATLYAWLVNRWARAARSALAGLASPASGRGG